MAFRRPPDSETSHTSVRFDRLAVDPDRCRPRAVVYVHLSGEALLSGLGVARVEDVGPLLLSRLRRLVGDSCQIKLQPVLDLVEDTPVDSYEVPARMREILRLRQPASCFPFGAGLSRRMDADHTLSYLPLDRGGPPGQTGIGKLGWMVRPEHRVKTFAAWRVRQPEPDRFVWRSPLGYVYLVDPRGTHPLGHGPLARAVWTAVRDRTAGRERSTLEAAFRTELDNLPKITIPPSARRPRAGASDIGRGS